MRTSALLLAAAAVIPATSQATVVLNGTWSYDINSTSLLQYAAQITVSYGTWTVNSIALDGITVETGTYTPLASDFVISLSQGGSTLGTANVTSVGSLVPHGNGFRSHFEIAAETVSGWSLSAGTYQIFVSTTAGSSIASSSLRTYGPFGGTGTNGFSYNGPTAVTLDVTGSGAPVPEPTTYGIVLGGLALAGAVVRRRRAK